MCRTTMYPWRKLTSYSIEEIPQTRVFKCMLENKHISVFTVPQRDGVLSEVSSPASAPVIFNSNITVFGFFICLL